jgi:hypothetical protein
MPFLGRDSPLCCRFGFEYLTPLSATLDDRQRIGPARPSGELRSRARWLERLAICGCRLA